MGQNYKTVLAPAYAQYADGHAQAICGLLGLDLTTVGPKIAKYIRCNGHVEIVYAARETQSRIEKARGSQDPTPVSDRWAYTVAVANGGWTRCRELYLRLGLYEHALRSRVEQLVTTHLGANWWQTPTQYMKPDDAANMQRTNPSIRQRPAVATDPNGVPPMNVFPDAGAFVSKLTLRELHAIVLHLWSPIFEFVMNPPGIPNVDFNKMKAIAWDLVSARNDVMHMRFLPKSAYPDLLTELDRLLAACEFDVSKTLAGIAAAPPV